MRTLIRLVMIALAAVLLAGCGVTIVNGSGKVITESRKVSNFSAVSFSGLGDITISQGSTESLTVEAEDNVMPLIKTEVTNGTCIIRFDTQDWREMVRPTKPIRFNLTLKNLTALDFSGAGNILAASLKTGRLTLEVSGVGNVKLERLEATELATTMTGAANVDIAGQVTKQEVEMSGAGQYSAGNLNSQTAKITVTGVGGATLWARDSLDVTLNGAGSVS